MPIIILEQQESDGYFPMLLQFASFDDTRCTCRCTAHLHNDSGELWRMFMWNKVQRHRGGMSRQ